VPRDPWRNVKPLDSGPPRRTASVERLTPAAGTTRNATTTSFRGPAWPGCGRSPPLPPSDTVRGIPPRASPASTPARTCLLRRPDLTRCRPPPPPRVPDRSWPPFERHVHGVLARESAFSVAAVLAGASSTRHEDVLSVRPFYATAVRVESVTGRRRPVLVLTRSGRSSAREEPESALVPCRASPRRCFAGRETVLLEDHVYSPGRTAPA